MSLAKLFEQQIFQLILAPSQNINTGLSPLDAARKKNHQEVVRLLEADAAGAES